MKREWSTPELNELNITATANGFAPSDNHDGPWVQINGKWYAPGDGKTSQK